MLYHTFCFVKLFGGSRIRLLPIAFMLSPAEVTVNDAQRPPVSISVFAGGAVHVWLCTRLVRNREIKKQPSYDDCFMVAETGLEPATPQREENVPVAHF